MSALLFKNKNKNMNIKKIYKTVNTSLLYALLFVTLFIPAQIFAYTQSPTGSFNMDSLSSNMTRPTISGSASEVKTIRIKIYKEGSSKTIYTSRIIKVRNDNWKVRVSKKLPDGIYDIKMFGADKTNRKINIATDRLVIGDTDTRSENKVSSTLIVEPIPLLSGGVAYSNQSIPVSYLQVINIGQENIIVKGFNVKQNGSAPIESISTLAISDDSGAFGIDTPFKNNTTFIPIESLFLPGQMKLFTIKAMMSNEIYSNIGKQLKLDIESISTNSLIKASFPIAGTTWIVGY